MEKRRFTDYERGWLEALIDGEGSILVHRDRKKQRGWLVFSISNTNRALLLKAQSLIGGKIRPYSDPNPRSRRQYLLAVYGKTLEWVLPQITLIVKEQQRQISLEIIHLRGTGPNSRLEELYTLIANANRRGIVSPA
jgi:hypothetical protein